MRVWNGAKPIPTKGCQGAARQAASGRIDGRLARDVFDQREAVENDRGSSAGTQIIATPCA